MIRIISKIALLGLFLAPFSTMEAQVLESGLMQGLSEEFAKQQGQTPMLPEEEDKEQQGDTSKPKNKQNYEDKDFGFTGGRKFNANPKTRFTKEPLTYFGYDFFADAPSTFAPVTNIPIPQDYIIGPGDNVKVLLFGNKNNQFTLKVSREGDIFFPEVGPINIAGLTFKDMKDTIENVVKNQFIGTQANISLGNLRSINIFILGDAFQPGMYTVSALSSLTNAIFASGGISPSGSLRNIQLKRNGELLASFDFYDLLLKGDTRNDLRLMSGDVIFIPPVTKTIGIDGEVLRPGIYELKDDENLTDLINFSGNFKPKANLVNADLTRINKSSNSFDLISLDLVNEDNASFELQNGDVISIFPVADNLKSAFLVSGHAQEPGFFAWKEGLRISDVFTSPDDLLEMTDINYLLIKRQDISSQSYEFLQVDLEKIFKDSDSNENILLMDKDELILFPWMLSSDLVTTKLIYDQYEIDEETNKLVLEDEWNSMTYLRKSLMEETLEIKEQQNIFQNQTNVVITESQENPDLDIRRYYEYSIYDYCIIPEDLAIIIIEESGFRAKRSIPLEDLENLNSPEDFILLQQAIEKERSELQQDKTSNQEISKTITDHCRRQLLDPIIDIVRSNDSGDKLDIVSVFGNVHFPGTYPYTNNMILSDAINAAGGPRNGTYNTEIELISRNNVGKKFSVTNNFASLQEANFIDIQEMDMINLKQLTSDLKTVEVTGEVFFPGVYPISENQTLGELIKRAGGIKDSGSVKAAYFQRDALKEAELDRLKSAQAELSRKIVLTSQSGGLGQQSLNSDSLSQLTALITNNDNETEALGRIVIDLENILNQEAEDLLLEDGDTINIPKKKQSVSVIGEIFVANSHIFQAGNSINDYISLSGGATPFADLDNLYLIKSDGSIVSPSQLSSGFFRSGSSILEPGDAIVVPLQVQPFSGIKATTEITQIIYQMALAAAAVNSF